MSKNNFTLHTSHPTLTVIDGNSLLFRAFYGVHSRLTRADGTPVNAVFGFCNMILPLLAAGNPDDIFICVFDSHRKNWRIPIIK
jgi:DNA polymerase-1